MRIQVEWYLIRRFLDPLFNFSAWVMWSKMQLLLLSQLILLTWQIIPISMNAHIQRSSAHLLITSRDLFAFCQVIIAFPCSWFVLCYCWWLQGGSLDWFQSNWSLHVGETSRNKGIGTGKGQEQECGKIATDHHAWFRNNNSGNFVIMNLGITKNDSCASFLSVIKQRKRNLLTHRSAVGRFRQVQPKRCCNRCVMLVRPDVCGGTGTEWT